MSFKEIRQHHIIGAQQSEKILNKINFPQDKIYKISDAILFHSRSIDNIIIEPTKDFYEAQVLADADNLDALGSIGLVRMVNFCQSQNFPIIKSEKDGLNDSIYGAVKYLLSYPEKMLTKNGKTIAKKRIKILQDFLKNLEKEYIF